MRENTWETNVDATKPNGTDPYEIRLASTDVKRYTLIVDDSGTASLAPYTGADVKWIQVTDVGTSSSLPTAAECGYVSDEPSLTPTYQCDDFEFAYSWHDTELDENDVDMLAKFELTETYFPIRQSPGAAPENFVGGWTLDELKSLSVDIRPHEGNLKLFEYVAWNSNMHDGLKANKDAAEARFDAIENPRFDMDGWKTELQTAFNADDVDTLTADIQKDY